jgi:hypothetical protein
LRNGNFIMDNTQQLDHLKCPFCLNQSIEKKSGTTTCPECSAEFDIDDRMECIFANTENLKLPVNGFVCGCCGLVQSDEIENCFYCGGKLNITMQ